MLIFPDLPNDWDVDEALEPLVDGDDELLDDILGQVPVIWPVSNFLCYNYLAQVQFALTCFSTPYLTKWVNETLDHYEKGGLHAAQRFMVDVEQQFVCRLHGEAGLRFNQVEGRLLPYARGLSGRDIDLAPSSQVYTDTSTIFLPRELTVFQSETDNFLLYKLITSFQWSFIELGTFFPKKQTQEKNAKGEERLWLTDFFSAFLLPDLARDIYHFLETVRAGSFLERELPGLMREAREIMTSLVVDDAKAKSPGALLSSLHKQFAIDSWPKDVDSTMSQCRETVLDMKNRACTSADSIDGTRELYQLLAGSADEYEAPEPLIFQGGMHLDRVLAACNKQRRMREEEFVDELATFLLTLPQVDDQDESEENAPAGTGPEAPNPEVAIIIDKQGGRDHDAEETVFMTINNQEVDLGNELADLAEEIIDDFGYLPEQYISSAAGKAGKGRADSSTADPREGLEVSAPITYDEWDFRRNGFRKNWCIVTEKEVPATRSTFIRATLDTYYGQIVRLRHQFEMMRTSERFVRRQRDGDDIDLDALVESLADVRAGLPPSDRLFIRLKRDHRDIAAIFLVDMSNSTEGWVGTAIKESLVLICEAMEVLGDRYGIYGFSGMRRLRCETFYIKHLDEPYTEEVRQRIGSISPREYTRMAPAIRHMTSILGDVDAKVRLLITLSDGKPEDYDDYKGDYAIEDTRHALLEAKSAGVHPFCITIDKHAHEYMAHMYGEVNYIFINDVRKLPARMPEIYRVLTT
ncbi:MAG: VWA domain-containing protein [Desulfobulbaceae bacterium]|nr:VWA domain-containing protein [Desulfobulbaceae bacterium]